MYNIKPELLLKLIIKKSAAYVLLCCFSTCLYAVAVTPVSTVYRTDSREYPDVFKNGFASWGNNIDFVEHVYGESGVGGTRDTAFVATTASLTFAQEYADILAYREAYRSRERYGIAYIYDIRATNNMYSAEGTLRSLYNGHLPPSAEHFILEQQEWAALYHIAGNQIRSVTVVEYSNGHFHNSTVANPSYMNETTHSNPAVFTGSTHVPNAAIPLFVNGGVASSFVSRADAEAAPMSVWSYISCCSGSNSSDR